MGFPATTSQIQPTNYLAVQPTSTMLNQNTAQEFINAAQLTHIRHMHKDGCTVGSPYLRHCSNLRKQASIGNASAVENC
jgi:hypothetical protein